MIEGEGQHHTEVNKGIFRPDVWWVKCKCGYQAGPFPRKLDADMDADEHIIQTSQV